MEVKPCPFCGNEPQQYSKLKHPHNKEIWYVACVTKTCPVQPGINYGYPNEEMLLEDWNMRITKHPDEHETLCNIHHLARRAGDIYYCVKCGKEYPAARHR